MSVPLTNEDYVVFYARKLKDNKELFKQQKKLIESQMKSSREIFRKKFGRNFKENARKYLREIGII